MRFAVCAVTWLSLSLWACEPSGAIKDPKRDAGDAMRSAMEPGADAGEPQADAQVQPDMHHGDAGMSADAAVEADGGGDAGGCVCVRGQCNAQDVCECDRGFTGADCSEPSFAGDGRDGKLVVTDFIDLGSFNHAGRSCSDGGDAVAYSLLAFVDSQTAQVTPAPAAGCLAEGDEVMLINLQGTGSSTENLGQVEFLHVQAVSGDQVQFKEAKQKFYGAGASDDTGLGLKRNQQRVMLQRVPQYESVIVPQNLSLTGHAWDGQKGGALALRVKQRLVVAGSLHMYASGYWGGDWTSTTDTTGYGGEGPAGPGSRSQDENAGGGGGGAGDTFCDTMGFSGAGGAHMSDGLDGLHAANADCTGWKGTAYGRPGRHELGAGGGAGGTDNLLDDNPWGAPGGAGGGALFVFARELDLYGLIDARGDWGWGDTSDCQSSSTQECWDFCGPGGGGAGGSLFIETASFKAGDNTVLAGGGGGGIGLDNYAGDGGDGGTGRIVIDSHGQTLSFKTDPDFSAP
jgi:hypothetical protein